MARDLKLLATHGRERVAVLVGALVTILVFALVVTGLTDGDDAHSARAAGLAPRSVNVQIDARRPGRPIPSRFLGISFELDQLGTIASYAHRGDLVQMLRSLGPGLMRFGGASADSHTAWVEPGIPQPPWATKVVDAADLRSLRSLASASGWKVLLTIGLGHYLPGVAAREAAAAKAILGPTLAAIEIGNEPDSFGRHHVRDARWDPAQYNAQVTAYRRAIAALAPGIPLAGPDVSGSRAFELWGPAEVRDQHAAILTGHHYPLRCRSTPPASIARLLDATTREAEEQSLSRYMKVALESGTPLRMDELGSVSCGGTAGISDTFGAALWATSYLARAMAAGVSGVNMQDNPARCTGYSVVCAPTDADLLDGDLRAQPVWYGMLLSSYLVSNRPVHALLGPTAGADVTVTAALSTRGRLHLVIVEEDPSGSAGVALHIHVGPGYRAASVVAMDAPSQHALSGAQLGGRSVSSDGVWTGPSEVGSASVRGGFLTVTAPASTAQLVTVEPG